MQTVTIVGMFSFISASQLSYINESIKIFSDEVLANSYKQYLDETVNKYPVGFTSFLQTVTLTESIDINSLKVQDALSKLTEQDKLILNL